MGDNHNFIGRVKRAAVMVLLSMLAGCGGGGGVSSPSASSQAYGDIEGVVDVTAASPRTGGRDALALAGAAVTLILPNGDLQHETADGSGRFQFENVPRGRFLKVVATSDGMTFGMYIDLQSARAEKNIDSRTTAAVVLYEEMKKKGKAASSTIGDIENSAIVDDLESAIDDSLGNGSYDYADVASGEELAEAMDRIDQGADLSDRTAPTISIDSPAANAEVMDVQLLSPDFYIEWSYKDGARPYDGSLEAALELEGESPIDISSALAPGGAADDSFSIRSGAGLNQALTASLSLATIGETRNAAIRLSVEDLSGNRSNTFVRSFVVTPFAPDPITP